MLAYTAIVQSNAATVTAKPPQNSFLGFGGCFAEASCHGSRTYGAVYGTRIIGIANARKIRDLSCSNNTKAVQNAKVRKKSSTRCATVGTYLFLQNLHVNE